MQQLREAKILATVKQVALTDRNQQTAPRFTNFSLMEVTLHCALTSVTRLQLFTRYAFFCPTVERHPLHNALSRRPHGGASPLCHCLQPFSNLLLFCPQELDVDAMNARAAVDEINREI